MRFIIVTPVLNGQEFLDETILSVVSQSGQFSIRYHVQDGGSTDATGEILEAWKKRLAGDFPIRCRGVEFSFGSEPDHGLYDAVNRGFAACGPADAMTWINADDRLEQGACATVTDIFTANQGVEWLTGRHTLVTESGSFLYLSPLIAYPRDAVAAGIFDGRFATAFVQQEGTFWRPSLWDKVGGVNGNFRLAGDFDLWRRFAQHADLYMVDAILGCFRVRAGQLTTNMVKYYAEVDSSLSAKETKERAKASWRYKWAGYDYYAAVRYSGGPWTPERMSMRGRIFLGRRTLKRLRAKLLSLLNRDKSGS